MRAHQHRRLRKLVHPAFRRAAADRWRPAMRRLLGELLEPVAALPHVREVRRRGLMTGIELDGFPPAARMGHRVTLAARRRGAVVRPLGDVVILMPPLAISACELRRLVEIVREAIIEATGEARPGEATPPAALARAA